MPAIKISLNRLIELFGKSVNDLELGEPVRALAARLMTLTAHVIRIDSKVDARIKELGGQIVALTEIVQMLAEQKGASDSKQSAPVAAPATQASMPAEVTEDADEEDSDEAFRQKALAEAAAEVAHINANANTPSITPLRKPAGAA